MHQFVEVCAIATLDYGQASDKCLGPVPERSDVLTIGIGDGKQMCESPQLGFPILAGIVGGLHAQYPGLDLGTWRM